MMSNARLQTWKEAAKPIWDRWSESYRGYWTAVNNCPNPPTHENWWKKMCLRENIFPGITYDPPACVKAKRKPVRFNQPICPTTRQPCPHPDLCGFFQVQ